jgi:hypothetical protein
MQTEATSVDNAEGVHTESIVASEENKDAQASTGKVVLHTANISMQRTQGELTNPVCVVYRK